MSNEEEMKVFVNETFKKLLNKPESLDNQLPKLEDAEPIIDQMADHWKASKSLKEVGQIKWISNIKMAFKRMKEAKADPALNQALHELIISVFHTMIMSPKTLLHNYLCMSFLGSVSEKLAKSTEWDSKIFANAKSSNRAINDRLMNQEPFIDFFKKANTQNAPYMRIMMADIFDVTIDSDKWQHAWTSEHLDQYIRVFNKHDVDTILVASELLDLQFKKKHAVQGSIINSTEFVHPQSTLSSTDASLLIQETMDLDQDLLESLAEASPFMSGTALYNEKELRFLNGDETELNLIRGQSGRCTFWDEKSQKFCGELASNANEHCLTHLNEKESETSQAIRELGQIREKSTGFSIMRNVFRRSIKSNDTPRVARYAPSLEGPVPAFRDAASKFERFLKACTLIHQDVKLGRTIDVQHFKDLIDEKSIDDAKWRHAFLAMNVSWPLL